MKHRRNPAWAGAVLLLMAVAPAAAGENGSAADAKAMLERAVAAVQADKAAALANFTHGTGGFRDRDLYVFCAGPDGRMDAHLDPKLMGRYLKDLYDVDGVAFGQEIVAVARADGIVGVSYMWPKPSTHTPVPKVTFVTRVADQICAVGYYK